jgi:S1-C subfamily serine protease
MTGLGALLIGLIVGIVLQSTSLFGSMASSGSMTIKHKVHAAGKHKVAKHRPVAVVANHKLYSRQEAVWDSVVHVLVSVARPNWLQWYVSPTPKKASGSGFFIDANGYIVTNYHVVEEAFGIKVQIPPFGKERFVVTVVGVCPERDVAVLKLTDAALTKIRGKIGKIPFLRLGDSDRVARRDKITVLGYPLRQERLKSIEGEVSGREVLWGESWIQISAALNPGNSGGPALNSRGEVVGINTARIPEGQSIGYIIPINDVKGIIKSLHTNPFLRAPELGGEFTYSTNYMNRYLHNPIKRGLYVARVFPGSLLQQAGVVEGDIIDSINGYPLDPYGETSVEWSEDKLPINALLNRMEIGQQVTLQFYHDGQEKTVSFAFKPVDDRPIRHRYPWFEHVDYELFGGMVLMDLSLNHLDALAKDEPQVYRRLTSYEKRENQYEPRVMVTHVLPTSQTDEARIVAIGDIICSVNGMPVGTLADVRAAIAKGADDPQNQGCVTFKTEDKKLLVLPFGRVVHDEERLAQEHKYRITPFMQKMSTALSADKEQGNEATDDE